MLVLGMDTSGRDGSLALTECSAGAAPRVLAECHLKGREFSSTLLPELDAMLRGQSLQATQLGLIAVASGPGSFTGLRIGLATAKAMVEAQGTPLAAISVLEAVALANVRDGHAVAALDAQRREIYWCEFELRAGAIVEAGEQHLEGQKSFLSHLAARKQACAVLTPDATVHAHLAEAGVAASLVERPDAAVYARLGHERLLAGKTTAPELLEANYIRRSDAEIYVAPKLGIPVE
jgi:tRNA threonylcarbamoyladenosine biosynthesis protein TsaB